MYKCTPVDLSYFDNAPYVFSAKVRVKASPFDIFESFEDHTSWPQWALPIQKVEWTSTKPFHVGTTRRVTMTGSLVGDEVFIAWDYPRQMAFCFTHSSQKLIESFAEDYQVTDLGDGFTEVKWMMAMTPKGFGKATLFLFQPFMRLGLGWMLNNFKKHIEERVSGR